MRQIAELYAGIIHGVDLTPTDEIDALLLLKGLQQMRRLTHVVDTFKAALGTPAGKSHPKRTLRAALNINYAFHVTGLVLCDYSAEV